MKQAIFAPGEIIYREGDASDAVYMIEAGSIEVSRHGPGFPVRLGVLERGDIFGEMGVIQDQPRSTTMTALDEVRLLRLPKASFLATFGDDNPMGLPLLRMLCGRLEDMDKRVLQAERRADSGAARISDIATIRLLPATPAVTSQIGSDGINIKRIPFRVGRRSTKSARSLSDADELLLTVREDLILSPQHFAIEARDGILMARDLSSYLGTTVNAHGLHRDGTDISAPLRFGGNSVFAGPPDSPYGFVVLVERPKGPVSKLR